MSAIIEAIKGVAQSQHGICHFGHYAERYTAEQPIATKPTTNHQITNQQVVQQVL